MSVSQADKVSREQLEKAARLRAEGATWNAIRETTGTKLGSSQFFRAWEREGIEHAAAGQKPRARTGVEESEPAPASKPTATKRRRASAK